MHDAKRGQDVFEVTKTHIEPTLEKIEIDEADCIKEGCVVDFGDFTGTVFIEGTLDIRRFIDTALNLPSFKNRGIN